MTGRERPPTSTPRWSTEVALVLVGTTVALGFARVFDGTSFLRPLLGFVLGAHLVAIATRRARVPGPIVVLIAIAGAALAATWILFPETARWGLPTSATWEVASAALAEARDAYPEVIAPTEAIPGFLLAAGLALWIAAWFADWTAHRLRAGVEAVAPAAAVFTFCAVLGSGDDQVRSAVAFAASVLAFLALQRGEQLDRDQAWSPDRRLATRALTRGAAVAAVVALGAGALVGPLLPGAGSAPALDWRGDRGGDGTRVTVSPMVELRGRLVDQSDVEVFRVTSAEPAYWRLTSLDRFDGEIWSSDGEFSPADDDLPSVAPSDLDGGTVTQAIEIEALSAIWVPAAFEAISVRSSEQALRWDPDSSTLIVDSESPTSDGLTYSVTSRTPRLDPELLAAAGDDDPAEIVERYESLPADFPDLASDLARNVTRGAEDRYAQALALQEHFRTTFEYSLEVPAGHGDDALVDFLTARVGYCEQFAGAYAAMARSLGIPARVAVGFTPGEQDLRDPDVYVVRGRHAHAWPEVYFPEVGWVPFEPTPGRGIPGGQSYTGVAPDQDDARGEDPTSTTETTAAPSTTQAEGATTTAARRDDLPARTETAASADADRPAPRRPLGLLVIVVLVAGAVAVLVARRRRAEAAPMPTGPADEAWRAVQRALASAGMASDRAETPRELAERAAAELPAIAEDPAIADDLRWLATAVDEERWAPAGDRADDADRRTAIDRRRDAVVAALGRRRPVGAGAGATGS